MNTEYDLTGKVIGLAMKIHSALGAGFLETVYHQALKHELTKAGLGFQSECAIRVQYDGAIVGEFTADFLIENELIVELKAVQTLAMAHEVQTVNYLVATGKNTGLLLNFGGERLEFKKKFRQTKPKISLNEFHSDHSVNSVQV